MTFEVIDEKKKEIKRKVSARNRYVRVTNLIVKFLWLCTWVYVPVFAIYNLVHPDMYIVTIRGVAQKDYDMLFTSVLFKFSFLGSMLLFAWMFRKKFESLAIGNRVAETLEIKDDELFYAYRLEFQSLPTERWVIIIKLKELELVEYDTEQGIITFSGFMFKKLVGWTEGNTVHIDSTQRERGRFVIYDYFSPSLMDELRKSEINE